MSEPLTFRKPRGPVVAAAVGLAPACGFLIIDLARDRIIALRRPMVLEPSFEPTWSSRGFVLAVPFLEKHLPPRQTLRLHLVDLSESP